MGPFQNTLPCLRESNCQLVDLVQEALAEVRKHGLKASRITAFPNVFGPSICHQRVQVESPEQSFMKNTSREPFPHPTEKSTGIKAFGNLASYQKFDLMRLRSEVDS